MISIKAHYDGKVFIPDEPVDLAPSQAVTVQIEPPEDDLPSAEESVLVWLAENPIESDRLPTDLSYQHDHYLYGTPKKPPPE